MKRARLLAAAAGVIAGLAWIGTPALTGAPTGLQLPDRLSDAEFWALSESLSEPPGQFHSDNLVSNEMEFQKILPARTAARVIQIDRRLGLAAQLAISAQLPLIY